MAVFVAEGAIDGTKGVVGLALAARERRRARRDDRPAPATTVVTMRGAIGELDIDATRRRSRVATSCSRSSCAIARASRRCATSCSPTYGKKKIKLDVVKAGDAQPGRSPARRPADPRRRLGHRRQARAGRSRCCSHLAANGWVGVNANYRLSPKATFPDHLVDLKKAIAWYREHADEHGADPDFCASPAVRPAATSARWSRSPRTTPSTRRLRGRRHDVQAAVPFYGVYDFTNRNGTWPKRTVRQFFEPMVMKKKLRRGPRGVRQGVTDRSGARRRAAVLRRPRRPRHARAGGGRARVRGAAAGGVRRAGALRRDEGRRARLRRVPVVPHRPRDRRLERFLHSVHEQYLEGRTRRRSVRARRPPTAAGRKLEHVLTLGGGGLRRHARRGGLPGRGPRVAGGQRHPEGLSPTTSRPATSRATSSPSEYVKRCRWWQGQLYEGGWAGITWPKAYGGRGGKPIEEAIFGEEQAKCGVSVGVFAVAHRHGRRRRSCSTAPTSSRSASSRRCCGARSCGASCSASPAPAPTSPRSKTRAVRDGDEFVVNGQKVWTSNAQHSDWGILLARTDPDAPQHRGITYFVRRHDARRASTSGRCGR